MNLGGKGTYIRLAYMAEHNGMAGPSTLSPGLRTIKLGLENTDYKKFRPVREIVLGAPPYVHTLHVWLDYEMIPPGSINPECVCLTSSITWQIGRKVVQQD